MDKRNSRNERGLRVLEVVMALLAVAFYVLCLISANEAHADDGGAQQSRGISSLTAADLKPEEHNGDFINRYAEMNMGDASMSNAIFDQKISNEMTEKYQAFERGYEAKQAYHLNGPEDEAKYQKSNQDLAEWTIKRLLEYHFDTTVKNKVEESAKQAATNSTTPEGRAAANAVSTVSSVQKAINNGTVNLGEDTKTKFHYDFPSGVMRVGMQSPTVDTVMDYRIKPADPAVGTVQQPERVSLGMNRSFKEMDASANAHYALMNQTVNCGVNKHLMGPLSAQVDQVRNMRDPNQNETVYRLNIGFKF